MKFMSTLWTSCHKRKNLLLSPVIIPFDVVPNPPIVFPLKIANVFSDTQYATGDPGILEKLDVLT